MLNYTESKFHSFAALAITALICYACSVEVYEPESSDDDQDHAADQAEADHELYGVSCADKERQKSYDPKESSCDAKNRINFLPNCKHADCEIVPVKVIYTLDQKIEENRTVVVEAFDNPRFFGFPVATSWTSRFNSKDAEGIQTQIFLAPGVYYLRAYLTRPGDTPRPDSYRSLKLVRNTPTGTYGALSGVEQLVVMPEGSNWQNQVEIYIDQLFSEDGAPSAPATESRSASN